LPPDRVACAKTGAAATRNRNVESRAASKVPGTGRAAGAWEERAAIPVIPVVINLSIVYQISLYSKSGAAIFLPRYRFAQHLSRSLPRIPYAQRENRPNHPGCATINLLGATHFG